MLVLFSHGKTTGPFIQKYAWIAEITAELGLPLAAIDYRSTQDPDRRIPLLMERIGHCDSNLILVGNSMGGYVSLVAAERCGIPAERLLLLAPALYMPGYQIHDYLPGARIIHGRDDQVIPYTHSLRYTQNPLLVEDDHALLQSKTVIQGELRSLIKRVANRS